MAVENIFPQNPGEVIVHISIDVVELADERVLDPVSDGLGACIGQMGYEVEHRRDEKDQVM